MAPTRDPTYYDDSGIVIQVGDILFKVEACSLTKHSEVFKDMLNLPAASSAKEGTNDANPVVLPQIKAEEFRNLLYVLYESPVDPDHISFMSGIGDEANQNNETFKRYLDVARLAHRFCMSRVEAWAKKQLLRLVDLNTKNDQVWISAKNLVAANSYARMTTEPSNSSFAQAVKHVLHYSIYKCHSSDRLEIYKSQPPDLDPVLRGALLARVLRDGPDRWTGWPVLSWAERAPLYALLYHITPLPDSPPFNTLCDASNIQASLKTKACQPAQLCPTVASNFRTTWDYIKLPRWKSKEPLVAAYEVNDLHEVRRRLVKGDDLKHCVCGRDPQCGTALLDHIDGLMDDLFSEIANICLKHSS